MHEPQSKKVNSPPSHSNRRPDPPPGTLVPSAVTQLPQSCCLCGNAVAVAAAGGAVECSGAAPQYESVSRQMPAS